MLPTPDNVREIHCRDCPDDPVEAVEVALVFLHYAESHALTFSRKRATMLKHAQEFARRAVAGL